MEFYKIHLEQKDFLHSDVYVKCLVYNPNVWVGHQWKYCFLPKQGYPTDDLKYAKKFDTVDDALNWIEDHKPR